MAASMTRWRRACWARVSGRASVCSIPTAYPPRHLGLRERGHYAGRAMPATSRGHRASSADRRQPRRRRTPSRWRPPTGGCPGERGRQTRQRLLDATVELLEHHLVALGQGHRHRPAGADVAGDLLPVLRQRGAGHPGAGRGDGRPGRAAGRAGGRRLVRGAPAGTRRSTVTEGFLAYWEDNRAVFRVVDLATEEGDAQLRGIRVRALNAVTVALAQVIAAASPSPSRRRARRRPRRPARTPWPWPARWWPCSPACRPTATASSSGASAPRNLIDTQAAHAALGRHRAGRHPPAEIPPREATRPRTGPVLGPAAHGAAAAADRSLLERDGVERGAETVGERAAAWRRAGTCSGRRRRSRPPARRAPSSVPGSCPSRPGAAGGRGGRHPRTGTGRPRRRACRWPPPRRRARGTTRPSRW